MSVYKVMSANRSEFFRSLQHFAPDINGGENSDKFEIEVGAGRALISLEVLPEKAITSAMRLPQLGVAFTFIDMDERAQSGFVAAFDQAFRRGGG